MQDLAKAIGDVGGQSYLEALYFHGQFLDMSCPSIKRVGILYFWWDLRPRDAVRVSVRTLRCGSR